MDADAKTSPTVDGRQWPTILARYRDPDPGRSMAELAVTGVSLVMLWATMWATLSLGPWLCLLLSIPTAGFLVRLFMIQHDCSHGSFSRRRAVNDWVGRTIGVVTLTPYDVWKRTHAIHHSGVGNLALRGIGDLKTMTVREYLRLTAWRRLLYRLYRHPAVLFGLGPAYMFLLQNRLPIGLMREGWRPWLSAMATNLAIGASATCLIRIVGAGPFLWVFLPTILLAASAGVWLFYVQHQFEHTYWEESPCWVHRDASLHGSSHYVLPRVLRWFTANIGVHHVHHLNSRIPFYRLPEVLRDHPELGEMGRLTIVDSLGCVRLSLWDEARKRLVSFREMKLNCTTGQSA